MINERRQCSGYIINFDSVWLLVVLLLLLFLPHTSPATISVTVPENHEHQDSRPEINADMVVQQEDNSDITDLAVDPTGTYIITANALGKIRLWELKTGLLLRTYSDNAVEEQGTRVIMAPTGDSFFSYGKVGIKRWSLSENKVLQSFGGSGTIYSIAFDPKADIMIQAGDKITALNLRNNSQIRTMNIYNRFYSVVASLVVSPDGKRFFTGYADGAIQQWDLNSNFPVKEVQEHKNAVKKLLIDPSRHNLVSVAEDGSIIVWDIETLTVVRKIGPQPAEIRNREKHDFIHTAAFDPHGRIIATGGSGENIYLWSFADGHLIRKISRPEKGAPSWTTMAGIQGLAFDPSERILITVGELGGIRLWDFKAGTLIRKISGEGHQGFNPKTDTQEKLPSTEPKSTDLTDTQKIVSVDRHLKYIVAKTNKDEINIWDTQSLRMLLHFGEKAQVTHCVIDPNAKYAITGTTQNAIDIYDLSTGALLRTLQPSLQQQKIAWLKTDPAGTRIIAAHVGSGPFPQNVRVKTLTVWDLQSGRLLLKVNDCRIALVDPHGRYLAGMVGDDTIVIWNLKSGETMRTIKRDKWQVYVFDIIREGKLVVVGYPDHTLHFWDVDSGAHRVVAATGDETMKSVEIDPSGRYIIYSVQQRINDYGIIWRDFSSSSFDPIRDDEEYPRPHRFYVSPRPNDPRVSYTTATVRSVDTGSIICRIDSHRDELRQVEVDPTGRYAVSVSYDHINVWDLRTGQLSRTLKTKHTTNTMMAIDRSGKYIVTASTGSMLSIWDFGTGELIKDVYGINKSARLRILNRNPLSTQPIIIATTSDDQTTILDLPSGNKLKIGDLGFENRISPDHIIGEYVLSDSTYNGITLWSVKRGQYLTLASKEKEWLVWSSKGYFDSSRYGGALLNMTKGLSIFGVDQFALFNNRPDMMLQEMGFGTDELIAHFYGQYQKRLRRSGFTAALISNELHVPEAKILQTTQSGNEVTITYLLSDTKYNLRKFNIFVNDVPLFGSYGREITGRSLKGTEKVELSRGKNKIEVTCMNEKGAESYRALTYVQLHGAGTGDLYFLGFGVSRYRDQRFDLKYADKDAKDLAAVFQRMKGSFHEFHTKIFINEEVTTTTIKEAKNYLKNAHTNDTVVLFVAGHGLHDKDKEATYYYLTYDADLGNLAKTAAPFDLIEDILQNINPRKKIFLLDTCESGELDDAIQNNYIALANARGLKPRTARAIRVAGRPQNMPLRSFVYDNNRYIYNDLSRRTGAVVFSSSHGAEFSYESDTFKNGLFTMELINALTTTKADKDRDGFVTREELVSYVSEAVSRDSKGLQHPTIDRDNIFQQIGFPVNHN